RARVRPGGLPASIGEGLLARIPGGANVPARGVVGVTEIWRQRCGARPWSTGPYRPAREARDAGGSARSVRDTPRRRVGRRRGGSGAPGSRGPAHSAERHRLAERRTVGIGGRCSGCAVKRPGIRLRTGPYHETDALEDPIAHFARDEVYGTQT